MFTFMGLAVPIGSFFRPDVSIGAIAVLRRHLDVLRHTWIATTIPYMIDPLIWLVGMGYGMGTILGAGFAQRGGASYLEFIAPGVLATSTMIGPALETVVGSFVRCRYQKVYDAIVATPCTVEDVAAGDVLLGMVRAATQASAVLIVMAGLGLLNSWQVALAPLFILASGFMFSSIGLCYSALIPQINWVDFFFSLVLTPLYVLSGTFFPLDQFPAWYQKLAWFAPLYHIVTPLRALVLGTATPGMIAHHLVWVLVVGTFFFLLGMRLIRRRVLT